MYLKKLKTLFIWALGEVIEMRILGVHDGHNASACLLEDGQIKYCIQEERLTNIKNYFGFPFKSIKKILTLANIDTEELDFVAMASHHTAKPSDVLISYKKQASMLRSKVLDVAMKTPLYSIYKSQRRRERLKNLMKLGIPEERVIFVDHHLCHASAAYYGSPWKDERVLILTNDGSGDGLCSTVYIGEDGNLNKIAETPKGSSIGNIYSRVTFMLGLVPWEHEWKVMGMAPYAPESGAKKSYEVFNKYLSVPDGALTLKRNISEPTYLIYPRLRRELELHRFDWISAGLQRFTEELLCKLVRNAIRKTGIHKIALSGGVFMNVKANKRIMEMEEVEDIFVLAYDKELFRNLFMLGLKSLTEYVISLIEENATKTINEHESVTVENDIFDRFISACEDVAPPNEALISAVAYTKEQGFE